MGHGITLCIQLVNGNIADLSSTLLTYILYLNLYLENLAAAHTAVLLFDFAKCYHDELNLHHPD